MLDCFFNQTHLWIDKWKPSFNFK